MYALFYAGYMLFGGAGYILGAVSAIDALRRHEEKHIAQLGTAELSGFWNGFGQAWPVAYRNGEEHMLGVCQALAIESMDMVNPGSEMQLEFNQLVDSWPEFALPELPLIPWEDSEV